MLAAFPPPFFTPCRVSRLGSCKSFGGIFHALEAVEPWGIFSRFP